MCLCGREFERSRVSQAWCAHTWDGAASLWGDRQSIQWRIKSESRKGEIPLPPAAPPGALGVGHLGKPGEMVPKWFLGAQIQPGGSPGENPPARLLWHCFPSGEGAFGAVMWPAGS